MAEIGPGCGTAASRDFDPPLTGEAAAHYLKGIPGRLSDAGRYFGRLRAYPASQPKPGTNEPERGNMGSHKFKLGQMVSIVGGRRQGAMPGGRFEIVRLLPETGGSNQYRVRSKHDGHERVVMESELA